MIYFRHAFSHFRTQLSQTQIEIDPVARLVLQLGADWLGIHLTTTRIVSSLDVVRPPW